MRSLGSAAVTRKRPSQLRDLERPHPCGFWLHFANVFYEFRIVEHVQAEFLFRHAILGSEISTVRT